jgi:hypothetical protein
MLDDHLFFSEPPLPIVSLPLYCMVAPCGKPVAVEYLPGPRHAPSLANIYECAHCGQLNRLELPGTIVGVWKRAEAPTKFG